MVLDTLWPDLEPEAALNNLHKALFVTRRALEPGVSGSGSFIQFQADTLILEAPGSLTTDVSEFESASAKALSGQSLEAYRTAVETYGGQLLPDDIYEEWSVSRRDELQQLCQSVLSKYSEFARVQGEGAEAIKALQKMLEIEPELESAHARLMTLFTEQGDRHRAIRQYQSLSQTLRTEFGMEPQPSTRELYESIIGGRVSLAKAAEAPAAVATPDALVKDSARSENSLKARPFRPRGARLVGRDDELRQFGPRLSELSNGNGSVALFSGPAGAGKSRLAQEIAAQASFNGAHVLRGGAYEFERQAPYGPFSEALDDFLADFRGHERQRIVDSAPIDIYPLLPRTAQGLGLNQTVTESHDREFLFAAVETFLRTLTQASPAVLIVDDLHTADESTLELFHFLARRAPALPLLLLGTYRSEGEAVERTLSRVLANIGRIGDVERIEVLPLEEEAVRSIVEETLGGDVEEDLFTSVVEISEGNPLFVEETVRTMQETGAISADGGHWKISGSLDEVPHAISQLVNDRLDRLSEPAHQLLSVAAVIGNEPEYEVLRAASSMDEDGVLDALDELLEKRIVVEAGDDYRFSHGLHRAVALANLSRARLRRVHTDVANGLLAISAGREDEFDDALAFHLYESRERAKAIPYLISAGKRAAAVFANEQALELFSKAKELLEQQPEGSSTEEYGTVLEAMGDVKARIGNADQSLELFKEAMDVLAPIDHESGIRSRGKAALAAINAEKIDEGEQLLKSVLDNISPEQPEHSLSQTYLLLAQIEWHSNQNAGALEAAEKALEAALSSGDEAEAARAYEALALSCHSLGDWQKGIEYELSRSQTDVPGFNSDTAFDAHL